LLELDAHLHRPSALPKAPKQLCVSSRHQPQHRRKLLGPAQIGALQRPLLRRARPRTAASLRQRVQAGERGRGRARNGSAPRGGVPLSPPARPAAAAAAAAAARPGRGVARRGGQ